ncbi:MAG: hypothetical protein GEU90_02825 [Gemmatimonas sp.]|nr:hypothetical protein [Gemmatimonas sp.]
MLVFAVALQAEAWQWIQGNWVSVVVMLGMIGLIVVLGLLALAPDPPSDEPEISKRDRKDRGPDVKSR